LSRETSGNAAREFWLERGIMPALLCGDILQPTLVVAEKAAVYGIDQGTRTWVRQTTDVRPEAWYLLLCRRLNCALLLGLHEWATRRTKSGGAAVINARHAGRLENVILDLGLRTMPVRMTRTLPPAAWRAT
jgi:hypothetical protein